MILTGPSPDALTQTITFSNVFKLADVSVTRQSAPTMSVSGFHISVTVIQHLGQHLRPPLTLRENKQ